MAKTSAGKRKMVRSCIFLNKSYGQSSTEFDYISKWISKWSDQIDIFYHFDGSNAATWYLTAPEVAIREIPSRFRPKSVWAGDAQ